MIFSIRYSDDYGLPQHRGRMWFHARLRQFTSPGWAVAYQVGMDEMAVGATIPLEKCLLTDDSSYLLSHHRHEQARAQRSTEKRLKWKTDHWVARRNESLMPPLLKHMPKKIEDISQSSKILDRELDFVRFLHQKGISIQQVALNRPAMELKHSMGRLHSFGKQESVSTILPGSRQLLLRTEPVRFMLGREALAIQGIGLEHSLEIKDVTETECMKLAGDAFSISIFIASHLAALACMELTASDLAAFMRGA